ncbi:MAG: hypothetical protein ASARMPREDX12_009343 [Alectoria sarmentosa]|nr:MAG: hypothetical protein ASARMPREDX12_009343 [Alectoria sarmentosa]
MKPNIRALDGLLQICYDLPHRVHTSKSYPLPSPNGSTILVYGHEQGLRVVWRGGRPFKHQPAPEEKKPKSNGATEDAIMIVDPDQEAPETSEQPPSQDDPSLEEENGDFDGSEPYEPIVQNLDLALGVEALHLAFPHLPVDAQRSGLESLPILFSQKLVLAVACSDFSVRVILIPLLPPSPQIKNNPEMKGTAIDLGAGKTVFGEQMIVLSSGTTHRSIPKGVSISMTSTPPEDLEDIDMDGDDASSKKPDLQRNISRSASRSRTRSRLRDHQWDLLIASHSTDLSGLLLIHRIPILSGEAALSPELHIPWRTQYLASPTVSVYFNSALYPASRHSQLLITEAKGVVKILDCLPRSKAAQGSWRLSLYTDFETLQDSTSRRKPILDAQWVLGGKAILALLADGKWVVWDLENAGPKPADGTNPPWSTSLESLTKFALEGWVGGSLKSRTLLKSSSTQIENRLKLAPMTPGTRKIRQQALFTAPTPQSDGPVRGGLFVSPVQDASTSRADDEAVLAWHGNTIAVIPSLFIHWQNKARASGNLFGSGAKGEPKMINNIQLGGESCKEASLMPSGRRSGSAKDDANFAEILITGDHRLVIVTSPIAEPQMPFSAPSPPLSSTTDQQLLTKGELDVNGMDRILAEMSNGQTTPTRNSRGVSHANGNRLLMS